MGDILGGRLSLGPPMGGSARNTRAMAQRRKELRPARRGAPWMGFNEELLRASDDQPRKRIGALLVQELLDLSRGGLAPVFATYRPTPACCIRVSRVCRVDLARFQAASFELSGIPSA